MSYGFELHETNHKKGAEVMPEYLIANYLPDDFDPSTVTEAMIEEIHALNRELSAAGSVIFYILEGLQADNLKLYKSHPKLINEWLWLFRFLVWKD